MFQIWIDFKELDREHDLIRNINTFPGNIFLSKNTLKCRK